MSRFYLTTAIDYVNSRPHLGTAYEKITADVIARYKRLCGDADALPDGQRRALAERLSAARDDLGLDPLAYCDQMESEFRDTWARLDVSFDDFIRTSEPRHRAGVAKMVEQIAAAGDIYEGVYEGYYCVGCEAFKPEKDLVDGLCPIHRNAARVDSREELLLPPLEVPAAAARSPAPAPGVCRAGDPTQRDPATARERAGRHLDQPGRAGWGIPLPHDPGSVVYVWFDALINYISAVGYGTDDVEFGRWWPANLHVIGKDITRFHCVVWPAMLMSAGLALPGQVFGHGFVHFKGQKLSKSRGTAVDPLEAAQYFGADPLRLYLVKEIAYGQDGDFSRERFEERYNVDLANNLGNLVNRVAVMVDRYRAGHVKPAPSGGALPAVAEQATRRYREAMDTYALHLAGAAVFDLVDAANEFIAETAPWTLARSPDTAGQLDQVLGDIVEAVRIAALLLLPIMPRAAAEILRRMGEDRPAADLRLDPDARWSTGRERTVTKAEPMWPRAEEKPGLAGPSTAADEREPEARRSDKEKQTMTSEPAGKTPAPIPATGDAPPAAAAPAQPVAAPAVAPLAATDDRVSIDEFMKIELRVAKVLAAERVPKSKKLVRMQIDVGSEERTIVAGIAEAYPAEALVGRTIVVVANLKPAKLMGIESNGMVLAASPEGGLPVLVSLEQPLPPGSLASDSQRPVIDSHCHLADEAFAPDLDQVVARAREAGLSAALCILAMDEPEEMARAPRVASAWPSVRFAIGVHPHQAGRFTQPVPETIARVRQALEQTPAISGVGEIGLDYHYDLSPRDLQRAIFGAQLALAGEMHLPVVVHTREAEADTVALFEHASAAGVSGVLHCFTGTNRIGPLGGRPRALHLVCRHRHVPERDRAARGCERSPARPPARRNRLPVSFPRPSSREAERAGARRRGGAGRRAVEGRVGGRVGRNGDREFPDALPCWILNRAARNRTALTPQR